MPEPMMLISPCEPCPRCVFHASVVAAEGTVLLRLRGVGSAGLKAFRDELGLTMQELLAAVRDGYRATPVEARHLMALLQEPGGPGGAGVTEPPPP